MEIVISDLTHLQISTITTRQWKYIQMILAHLRSVQLQQGTSEHMLACISSCDIAADQYNYNKAMEIISDLTHLQISTITTRQWKQ